MDTGEKALYVVKSGAGSDAVNGTSANGNVVGNYVGTLQMDTDAPIHLARVDPSVLSGKPLREIAGPPVTDQSLQLAVEKHQKGLAQSRVAYSGVLTSRGVDRGPYFFAKVGFVRKHGGFLSYR